MPTTNIHIVYSSRPCPELEEGQSILQLMLTWKVSEGSKLPFQGSAIRGWDGSLLPVLHCAPWRHSKHQQSPAWCHRHDLISPLQRSGVTTIFSHQSRPAQICGPLLICNTYAEFHSVLQWGKNIFCGIYQAQIYFTSSVETAELIYTQKHSSWELPCPEHRCESPQEKKQNFYPQLPSNCAMYPQRRIQPTPIFRTETLELSEWVKEKP